MFDECVIRGHRFAPARFCAPLAGYTHSAFRRLLAELGGCGATWTEMLAARQILAEDFTLSPWVRRRPEEGFLFYQLMVRSGDPLDRIMARLQSRDVEAVDLNLACGAWNIRACEAGAALFENLSALQTLLRDARRHWPGLLTVKIRLGQERPDWQPRFLERLRLIEAEGVDAVILHPRFSGDKFKRRARTELFPWVAENTPMPVIANGDLNSAGQVRDLGAPLQSAQAVMIGRMAVAQPWIFSTWDNPKAVDMGEIWRKMHRYIAEDFEPPVAIRRIKMFTKYFAANFQFGHAFNVSISNAPDLEEARLRAEDFFSRNPATLATPMVAGL